MTRQDEPLLTFRGQQARPRRALVRSLFSFSPVVLEKQRICRGDKLLIRYFGVVDATRNAKEVREYFALLRIRKVLEIVDDMFAGGGHVSIIRMRLAQRKFRPPSLVTFDTIVRSWAFAVRAVQSDEGERGNRESHDFHCAMIELRD